MWEFARDFAGSGTITGVVRGVSGQSPPGENAGEKARGVGGICKAVWREAEAHPSAPFTGEKSVSDRMCLEKPPGESVTPPEESRARLTSAKGQDTQ